MKYDSEREGATCTDGVFSKREGASETTGLIGIGRRFQSAELILHGRSMTARGANMRNHQWFPNWGLTISSKGGRERNSLGTNDLRQ